MISRWWLKVVALFRRSVGPVGWRRRMPVRPVLASVVGRPLPAVVSARTGIVMNSPVVGASARLLAALTRLIGVVPMAVAGMSPGISPFFGD